MYTKFTNNRFRYKVFTLLIIILILLLLGIAGKYDMKYEMEQEKKHQEWIEYYRNT